MVFCTRHYNAHTCLPSDLQEHWSADAFVRTAVILLIQNHVCSACLLTYVPRKILCLETRDWHLRKAADLLFTLMLKAIFDRSVLTGDFGEESTVLHLRFSAGGFGAARAKPGILCRSRMMYPSSFGTCARVPRYSLPPARGAYGGP